MGPALSRAAAAGVLGSERPIRRVGFWLAALEQALAAGWAGCSVARRRVLLAGSAPALIVAVAALPAGERVPGCVSRARLGHSVLRGALALRAVWRRHAHPRRPWRSLLCSQWDQLRPAAGAMQRAHWHPAPGRPHCADATRQCRLAAAALAPLPGCARRCCVGAAPACAAARRHDACVPAGRSVAADSGCKSTPRDESRDSRARTRGSNGPRRRCLTVFWGPVDSRDTTPGRGNTRGQPTRPRQSRDGKNG